MDAVFSRIRLLGVAVFMMAVTACSPVYESHGYAPSEYELEPVVVGASTREAVVAAVGQPMVTNTKYGESWFYVGTRFRHYGMNEPEVVDRNVVVVSFDDAGNVSNVERFTLADGKTVSHSRRVTETNLGRLSLVEQLLRSLGRVDPAAILENQ